MLFPQTMILVAVFFLSFQGLIFQGPFDLGNAYYISPSGSDSNSGLNASSAFETFNRAMTVLQPGDTLNIMPGTYSQEVDLDVIGTQAAPITIKAYDPAQMPILDFNFGDEYVKIQGQHLIVQDLEVMETSICIRITGQDIVVSNVIVHECEEHGVLIQGQNVVFEDSTIFRTNLENSTRIPGTGWGSGLKVGVGGDNLILQNNLVYQNYGEGIAVTRGTNVQVLDNVIYDNYAMQIYIDNSHDILVEGNLAYCTDNTEFDWLHSTERTEPTAIGIAEEKYVGWGAQLARVQIINNITSSCDKGIGYFAAEVPGAGMDTLLIAHNTFWNSDSTAIWIVSEPEKTRNTIIANNIFDSANGELGWIEDRTEIDMFNNLWVDEAPANWRNIDGVGDIHDDPQFATTPFASDATTFRLSSDSPAIGAAADLPGYTIAQDFEGKTRTPPTDIGAIEFNGGPSPS